jgi:hypothetical protein
MMAKMAALIVVAAFFALLFRYQYTARGFRSRWTQTAKLLEARYEKGVLVVNDEIRGETNGLYYTVVHVHGRRPSSDRATVRFHGANIPAELELARCSLFTKLIGERIETGDESFDRMYDSQGDPSIIAAVLDGHLRQKLVLAPAHIQVKDRVLEAQLTDVQEPAILANRIKQLAEIAALFRFDLGELSRRLLETFRSENRAETRRLVYTELVGLARNEQRLEALELGLEHPDRKIRCIALDHLGADLWHRALEIFRSTRQHPSVRAAALEALVGSNEPPGGELVEVAKRSTDELIAVIIRALAVRKDESQKPFFVDCLAHKNPLIRATAAAALQRLGAGTEGGFLSLSPVEDTQGAVSLSDRSGALSVTSSRSSEREP